MDCSGFCGFLMPTMRKKAFTLIELLIVISILGIMAAIVMPMFQGNLQQTREAAAKDNLRILRTTIEAYTAKNNGIPPGYVNNEPPTLTTRRGLGYQLIDDGHYVLHFPENPFSGNTQILPVDTMPDEATGEYGWLYQPSTKQIRLDWPGVDSNGVSYFDY